MRILVLTALLAGFSGFAHAEEMDCSDPQTQTDMNICAHQDYEAADAELNAVWKDAMKMAKDLDADQDDALKGAHKDLLDAQRGWIAYRDGNCALAGWDARGGSMEPMLVSGCLAEMTRQRTKELRDFASGAEQ